MTLQLVGFKQIILRIKFQFVACKGLFSKHLSSRALSSLEFTTTKPKILLLPLLSISPPVKQGYMAIMITIFFGKLSIAAKTTK